MRTTPQPRVPSGVPSGGQWSEREHGESDLALREAFRPTCQDLAWHHEKLSSGGYVPASTWAAVDDPGSSDGRGAWWDEHFTQAEYHGAERGYAQMPDDWTPRRTGGQAMSGHRRTHRMAYTGDGVQIRMPSATSVKAFAKEHGTTFDIPVSARLRHGSPLSGWVRVTRNSDGQWATTGLGHQEENEEMAEAVRAVLESRRPSRALRGCGDLIERRRAKESREGVTLGEVRSTWISSIGYDPATRTMMMRTATGSTYGHRVPRETFEAVQSDRSPGAQFNRLVKGNPRAQVAQCPTCQRVYAQASGVHTCPPQHQGLPAQTPTQTQLARRRAAVLGRVGWGARQ